MLGLGLTPAPRAALLARDRARSDDLEAGDGPDPVRHPAHGSRGAGLQRREPQKLLGRERVGPDAALLERL